jgi:hypothetical protein
MANVSVSVLLTFTVTNSTQLTRQLPQPSSILSKVDSTSPMLMVRVPRATIFRIHSALVALL